MARTLKAETYTARRNTILDSAQRFIYTKGYEQMTIQDILDDLQMSKGAFYHYFDSKTALLEALLERIQVEARDVMLPIARDPRLPTFEKFRSLFPTIARWKTARKAYLIALLEVVYSDDNALFREKARAAAAEWMVPLVAEVIAQGITEGAMRTDYPDVAADVVMTLLLGLSDALVRMLLAGEPHAGETTRYLPAAGERTVAGYQEALERALGAPAGSLPLVDVATLREWEQGTGS